MNVTFDQKHLAIDLLFGACLIIPIVFTAATGDLRGTYVAVGVSVSYALHTTDKMLAFQERLRGAVEEEAEEQVEKKVEETTPQ